MPPTHLKFRTGILFSLATAVLCFLPADALAQLSSDLLIENFSVFSTLPEADGFRRVSISFSVVNRGLKPAGPSTTRVTIDNSGFSFATPPLERDAKAFISRPFRTAATELDITVLVNAFNNIPSENNGNNELKQTANLKSEANRWISIGPSKIQDARKTFGPTFGVGRVTMIAVDPRSPLTVYAGSRGSGIWKRLGAQWFPIGDALPSTQIDAIGIYPRTPDRVVVATPMGVFESLDGGGVWSQLTSENLQAVGSDGGALLIEDADKPALYVSTTDGLRVSTDSGRTWEKVLRPGSQIVSLQFSTTDRTHLLASSVNPPLVFEAKDRGLKAASWHILLGCVAPLPTPFPPNATVWITESGIRRWVSIVDFSTGKVELWRTTNRVCRINGFTEHAWEKVSLSGDCAKSANNFSYLFAHPTDASLVFKGGIALCRSDHAGDSLKTVSGIHFDHHAIALSRADPDTIFFGNDGGIYRSPNKGKTMEFFGEGLNNTEFLKIDTDGKGPQFVVGGSQDQFTSTWNGTSPIWNLVSAGNVNISDSSLVAFDRADRSGIFEIGQSTRQLRLLKPGGGETRLGDSSLPDCCSYSEFPANVSDSMESTGRNPRVVLTCQGIWSGPPWRQIQPSPTNPIPTPNGCKSNPPGDFRRLRLHPSGVLVAVTDTGQVFHGLINQPPPVLRKVFQPQVPGAASAISFDGPGRFYVATNPAPLGRIDRFDCFISCNRESVWLTNLGDITAITIDPLATDTLLAAVRNRGVFRGTRNGPNNWTWTEYNNGLPFGVTVTDLEPQTTSKGIIAATYGRGAFQLFSQIRVPPGNQQARGRITSYEIEREDPKRPPGPNNPVIETIELDSKPNFIFTKTGAVPSFAVIARDAIKNKRIVTIEFKPLGPQSGTIISLR
jgi:hypothetical protein